ncbi:MAG: Gfo/Idh/MocA family protein [Candidatus Helarchaeota archaeon]
MDFVKFGVIGLGGAWQFHKPFFINNSKAKLISVYDIDIKKSKRTAKFFNADYYGSLQDFFNSDIDAVLILVPHYLHKKFVISAAQEGKHILCEKPMAILLEDCDEMIRAANKAGVKFMVAENHRFLPAHNYIFDIIKKGLIGDIFLIRAYEGVYEVPALMKPESWKGHPIMAGGGALMDMGVHKFAVLNWILNDHINKAFAWITKQCTNLKEKAEDNAMIFLKYNKGTIAEITISFTVVSEITNSLEIYGTNGTILENHMWKNPIKIQSFHKEMGKNKGKWFEPYVEHGPFPKYYLISAKNEDEHFTNCILKNEKPDFDPKESREAIADALLCYLSVKNGKSTTMNEFLEVYNKEGTISILDGLEKFVQNNYNPN